MGRFDEKKFFFFPCDDFAEKMRRANSFKEKKGGKIQNILFISYISH